MRELEAWGEFLISKVEGLGHSHTTISRAAKNQLCSMGHFQSRLPNGVLVPGLRQFNIVEKVLQDFRPQVRQTALVEYVLPRVVVGRMTGATQQETFPTQRDQLPDALHAWVGELALPTHELPLAKHPPTGSYYAHSGPKLDKSIRPSSTHADVSPARTDSCYPEAEITGQPLSGMV